MSTFKLDNHPKISSGFKITEPYFTLLSEKIINNTTAKKTAKVIALKSQPSKWILAIAAVVVLVFLLPITIQQIKSESMAIDKNAIESYLITTQSVSQFELVNQLSNQDIKNLELDLHLNTNDIEEYLATQNIETYIIE